MSLKTFHIIFVVISTLLCTFVAVWGFKLAPPSFDKSANTFGCIGVSGAVLMTIYGFYFYGKIKKLSSKLEL